MIRLLCQGINLYTVRFQPGGLEVNLESCWLIQSQMLPGCVWPVDLEVSQYTELGVIYWLILLWKSTLGKGHKLVDCMPDMAFPSCFYTTDSPSSSLYHQSRKQVVIWIMIMFQYDPVPQSKFLMLGINACDPQLITLLCLTVTNLLFYFYRQIHTKWHGQPKVKQPTLWLMADPLYHLKYSHPILPSS